MELKSQVDIELTMYHGGIRRAESMMSGAEEKGRASQNPYAKTLMRDFVLPIADAINSDCMTPKRGRNAAHIALLKTLDPDAVAFLAVRYTLNMCMNPRDVCNERTIGFKIGSMVNAELVLAQIEEHNPELYHTLANDLQRRLSKDERHRLTVFKMQAAKAGIDIVEWPLGAKEQVGSYLLGLLVQAGMVDMAEARELRDSRWQARDVVLSAATMEKIDKVKAYVAVTSPVYGPCVEPPRNWTSAYDGGFHTRELRRTLPMLIRCHPTARPRVKDSAMPIVLAAANALQNTPWKVNKRLLATVIALGQAGIATDEIVASEGPPKPARPDIPEDIKADQMTEADANAFKSWKHTVAEWHTQKKLQGVKYGRFYAATRAATMFEDYPAIYFVYFADSRGRFYPMTYGVNPQGSDLQKSLLHFAKGEPLDTPEAIRWFHIQGANKFGFDKATLTERFLWVHERRELILAFAADPVNNRGWLEAGDPLQFLSWCFEYADFVNNPDGFLSHIPISMDGSCNGLQNLSAMLRDEVGGKATNLTANVDMEDIYRRVAEATTLRLMSRRYEEEDKERCRILWLENGVSRTVVKRSVMTTPYGVTMRSATDYVIADYLKHTKTPFAKEQFRLAARVLMDACWPAIGDVVVKGRLAMDWLKKGARKIAQRLDKDGLEPVIEWDTPSGFPASQAYFAVEIHRINTRLAGSESIKLRVASEADDPDPVKHASGLAPNFVHSMDAAHLHRVSARCLASGIDAIAMIHDDYGTHARNAQALYHLIREEFVAMYEGHDPVAAFYDRYPEVGPPPAKGALDIREVLESEFFFS